MVIAVFFVIGKVTDKTEEEPKPTETKQVVEQKKEEKKAEPKKRNDEQAQKMVEQLKEDIRLNYGDTNGEKAVSWYRHFVGYRIDLQNKMVYVESDLPSSDTENAEHLASSVLNTMNLEQEKYFHVKKVVVLDKNGKEMSTKENYQ